MLAFHVTCNHYLQPKFFRHHLCFPFIYTYCSTVCIQLSRYFSIFLLSEQQTNLFAHFDPECQDHRKGIKVLFCLGLQSLAQCFEFRTNVGKQHLMEGLVIIFRGLLGFLENHNRSNNVKILTNCISPNHMECQNF